MYTRFTDTNTQLIEVQRKDVELVRLERRLTEKALDCAGES